MWWKSRVRWTRRREAFDAWWHEGGGSLQPANVEEMRAAKAAWRLERKARRVGGQGSFLQWADGVAALSAGRDPGDSAGRGAGDGSDVTATIPAPVTVVPGAEKSDDLSSAPTAARMAEPFSHADANPKLEMVVSGGSSAACSIIGDCITNAYGPFYVENAHCEFRATVPCVITATEFETRSNDAITVGGTTYSGDVGPKTVALQAGDFIEWRSDSAVVTSERGFYICAFDAFPPSPPMPPAAPPKPPSPPPHHPQPPFPPPPPHVFSIIEGTGSPCRLSVHLEGFRCFTNSPDDSGFYGNNEHCMVRANVDINATATRFHTESGFDILHVGGVAYSGNTGPTQVSMVAGQVFTWESDSSYGAEGFEICADVPMPPPMPPSMPPSPTPSPPPLPPWTSSPAAETEGKGEGEGVTTPGKGQGDAVPMAPASGQTAEEECGGEGQTPCVADQITESDGVCFAKASSTACLLLGDATPAAAFAACYEGGAAEAGRRVLMAELLVGDRVLTASGGAQLMATHILVNQHTQADRSSTMLSLHTSDGSSLSLTPDHALFVDGKLAAARDAAVGSLLMSASGTPAVVERVATRRAAIINPVTASGTLLASDSGSPVLAASHPIWLAPLVLDSALARTAVAAATLYCGDVASVTHGVLYALAKTAVTLAVLVLGAKAVRGKASSM